MKFAIIIPTFNRPALLVRAIRSVLAQTYPNWVLVVCDDCSTVDYSEVDCWLNDPRIFLVRTEKNGGCNAARNKAIDKAFELKADYILTTLDDEDELDPLCLEKAVQEIEAHPHYGWFISNSYGAEKSSSRSISQAREFDWIDDYMYGKSLRGDKAQIISMEVLGSIRFDARYRSSNMWPFFLPLAAKTKIWGYPYLSLKKDYLEGGITRGIKFAPKSYRVIYSRFAKHAYCVYLRPGNRHAYKYLFIELVKSPGRILAMWIRSGRVAR
jgi:glycosyltransferase involved in cell wall biosynthesis